MEENKLAPTLWRTCRILANIRRLKLLKAMLEAAEPLTVTGLADRTGLPMSACCENLRKLAARGLIHATRNGREVRHSLIPDRLVHHATPILDVVIRTLRTARTNHDYEVMIKDVTAFTYPRRMTIVRELNRLGRTEFLTLQKTCGIPRSSFIRQIHKLKNRDVIRTDDDWEHLELAPQSRPLASELLRIVCEDR